MQADTYRGGPILRYGGKAKHAKRIVPLLPKGALYLEPFFGAGGLFFAIPEALFAQEVINDLDNSIITFFRVLRDQPAELRRLIEATPYARDEFRTCLERSEVPLEEARRVWVRARQSINGVARVAGNWRRPGVWSGETQPLATRVENKIANLDIFATRLRRVAIECQDAIALIARYAEVGVSMYLDPPYLPSTRRTFGADAYEHELTHQDHERLLAACVDAVENGAKVALSGYPSELYRDTLTGWRCVEWSTSSTSNPTSGGRNNGRVEALWMSYPEADQLCVAAQNTLDLEVAPC